MKINILALDGVVGTGPATVLDAFAIANELAAITDVRSALSGSYLDNARAATAFSRRLSARVCRG